MFYQGVLVFLLMGILHLMNALEKGGMTMLSVDKPRALISSVCSVSAKGLPFLGE